jgi:hypothetical protein
VRPMMTKGGRAGKHGRRSGSALSEGLGITRVRARQGRAGPTILKAPDEQALEQVKLSRAIWAASCACTRSARGTAVARGLARQRESLSRGGGRSQ